MKVRSFRWIGLAVLLTAALGIAACGDSDDGTPSETASPTPSSTASETPPSTLAYKDATYGYSFEYPASWFLVPPNPLGGNDVIMYSYDPLTGTGAPVPKDKLKVFIWVAEGVDKSVEEWLEDGRNSPGQIVPPTVLSQTEVALGGKPGLLEVSESDGIQNANYYIPLGGGRIFVINAGPADSDVWPDFESVLDSVRFSD